MSENENLLDYAAVAGLLGKSVGAVRNMKLRGQLPQPDGPGPSWRRATVEEYLAEGAKTPPAMPAAPEVPGAQVPAAGRSAAPEARPAPAPSRPTPPPAVGEDEEDRRRRSITLAEVLECPHPEDERKKTGYMTMCIRCGRRQVGPDRFAGAGFAGWDAAKLATCPHPAAERAATSLGARCGVCLQVAR